MNSPAASNNTPLFWEAARTAQRIMVLDLGFLGDTVHLLPALWAIRTAWPNSELHVMVAEHVTQLLQVAPWIDRIWGYPRFPKGPKPWQDWGRIGKLRAARFDAVINLNGSDRSSLLTWITGARWRLGRRPEGGGPWHWPFQFTHIVDFPYKQQPVWQQRWLCLKQAGLPLTDEPRFKVELPTQPRRDLGIGPEDDSTYIHISPFTTQDLKELPLAELAALVNGLTESLPKKRITISCAPNARERSKMELLLQKLNAPPWKLFPGNIGLIDLISVMAGSAAHLGGDSGALHLALMAGIPTVSWFREYPGLGDWAPRGSNHRVLVGRPAGKQIPQEIQDLRAEDLLHAAAELLNR